MFSGSIRILNEDSKSFKPDWILVPWRPSNPSTNPTSPSRPDRQLGMDHRHRFRSHDHHHHHHPHEPLVVRDEPG